MWKIISAIAFVLALGMGTWMYGDTKPRLCSHDPGEIVRFVNELKRGSP